MKLTPPESDEPHNLGADDRARTGDLDLGKVALYQLSYVRVVTNSSPGADRNRLGSIVDRIDEAVGLFLQIVAKRR